MSFSVRKKLSWKSAVKEQQVVAVLDVGVRMRSVIMLSRRQGVIAATSFSGRCSYFTSHARPISKEAALKGEEV